jgi:hypothetical protein
MKLPTQWNHPESQLITSINSNSSSSCGEEEILVHEELHKLQQPQQPQEQLLQQQPQRRGIRFASHVSVQEIPNRDDFSTAERHAVWFQSGDYASFRSASSATLGLYRAGMLHHGDTSVHTMRGLEGRLEDACRARYQARYHATHAVWNEQQRQRLHKYDSIEMISDLYHAVTWKSQYAAYTRALMMHQDEQEEEEPVLSCSGGSPSNALRKVIAIERNEEATPASSAASCAFQFSTAAEVAGFDIDSFFSDLATNNTAVV